jgi:hypothetical protein
MNRLLLKRIGLKLAVTAGLSLLSTEIAGAQTYYTPSGYGDLVAGFRKTGSFAENNEMVVNLGNVTNFLKLSIGTTINITNYSRLQLTNMCPDNLENLQWSVFSTFQAHGFPDAPWVTPLGAFPPATCWYTLARTDANTQTTPPVRYSYNSQGNLRGKIIGVGSGAKSISQSLGVTNQFNNSLLVTEPVTFDGILSTVIGDPADASFGDFGGQTLIYSVENTTPSPFSSPVRSDLYQSCSTPIGPGGINMADPITGQTNGPAYYVGYFTLNTDGTMTFTRAASSSGGSNPPPQPVLAILSSIAQGGSGPQVNSTISFSTTNGATYTLYFTNASGLNTPITNWPSLTTTVTGDGSMHTFTNSSSDPSRFYSVGAH